MSREVSLVLPTLCLNAGRTGSSKAHVAQVSFSDVKPHIWHSSSVASGFTEKLAWAKWFLLNHSPRALSFSIIGTVS